MVTEGMLTMHIELKKKDFAFLAVVFVVFLCVTGTGWLLSSYFALGGLLILAVMVILASHLRLYRVLIRLHNARYEDYRQLESLFSLISLLKIRAPLPETRDWASSPDFLRTLVSLIFETKPRLIVELGSGVSTIIAAYSLEQLGVGAVISFDNDERFASMTSHNLANHGLTDRATVIHAPLTDIEINGTRHRWYDTGKLSEIDSPIDILIVDGPPETTQYMARYPALPLLYDRLAAGALVVADDTKRKEEGKMVEAWMREFRGFSLQTVSTEKGMSIMRREHPSGS